jgi:hypothetical protein
LAEISSYPSRHEDVGYWWESVFKPGLKQITVGYCRKRARDQRRIRELLQQKLEETLNASVFDFARYSELKRKFLAWERATLKGYEVRSRVESTVEEEPSIHHVKQAADNFRKSLITELETHDNRKVTEEREIREEIVAHFKSIFTGQPSPDHSCKDRFLEGVRGVLTAQNPEQNEMGSNCAAQLVDAQALDQGTAGSIPGSALLGSRFPIDALTAPLTNVEFKFALAATKPNKSPGSDGIPFEFYSKFWESIAPHFLEMAENIFAKQRILPSQGRATIRLVPKVPQPKRMTDYRPISLLNTDYKLLASVLANRLRKSLPNALLSHQKGGVPGRYIFDSLCLFRDVIDDACRKSKSPRGKREPVNAAIIAYDLEKAYDLVNRDTLWETMEAMGYPSQFIDRLKTLYSITQLCPLNGSSIVGTIDEAQSVRQGCPLSIHLFAIYIEPLLVRLSNTIAGYNLHGERIRVRAYVDDLVVFVSSHTDILRASKTIEEFCAWTKARVNRGKTKLLGLGNWALKPLTSTASPSANQSGVHSRNIKFPVDWIVQVEQLKLLGVLFTSDIQTSTRKNWARAEQTMAGILSRNVHRNFTFYGRVLFIKQHVISQATHLAHVLPCQKSRAEAIRKKLGKFLWAKRAEHPPLSTLIRPRKEGGLGAILPYEFFMSLYTRTLFKSFISPEGPERLTAAYWLGHTLNQHSQQLIRDPTSPRSRSPPFIKHATPTIIDLLQAGLFTSSSAAPHRQIYHHLISKSTSPGRTETARPELDWSSIWKWVAKIRGREGELVWDYNHNQLPTKLRLYRLHRSDDDQCPICNCQTPETDDHLMLLCPARQDIQSWLRIQLTKLHCTKPIRDAIHGDIGACPTKKRTRLLIQVYITANWTARTHNRVPTISELQSLWQTLLHQQNTT